MSSQHSQITDARAREAVARLVEGRTSPARAKKRPMPRWARIALRVMPRVLGIVTVVNGLIGLVAIVTPLLRVWLGTAITDPIYSAYALICPQRPSHTFTIAGEPMAMEQRMVAMYLAFGVVGLLYGLRSWARLREPLPTGLTVLALTPLTIDLVLSTAGIRPSDPWSRLLTGALASLAIIWWAYPRFDAQLRRTRVLVDASRARATVVQPLHDA
jgi:uncharacterized membrane protein